MEILLNIITYFIFFTFLISSVLKIIFIKDFIGVVKDYRILPSNLSTIFGSLLPFFELVAAICLIFEDSFLLGASLILLMLISFFIGVYHSLKKNITLSCGCYGKLLDSQADKFTLIKIITLITLTLILILCSKWLFNDSFSFQNLFGGLILSFLLILIQKLWDFHQKNIQRIKAL